MSEAPPPIPVDEAKLDRLAELDLALAEKAHALAMAATEPEAFNGHVRSYQRAARSLRQTLALKAKIVRDRALDAQRAAEARAEEAPLPGPSDAHGEWRIEKRLEAVQDAVGRVIAVAARERPEVERPDWVSDLYARFDRELDDWTVHDPRGFMAYDIDSIVRDMCARLLLSPHVAAQWRDLPPIPWIPDPATRDAADLPPPAAETG